MTPTAAALAVAAEQLRADRRSAVREIHLSLARAIARGRMPCLAAGVEETLLRELGASPGEDVEVTWTAHLGQSERVPWSPGTPLPDHALFVSCSVSAPLQEVDPLAREAQNVTAFPQVDDVLTVKQPWPDGDVSPDEPERRRHP